MARLIQVIETEQLRGSGHESNPFRVVRQYFAADGTLLAEHDPQSDEMKVAPPISAEPVPETV